MLAAPRPEAAVHRAPGSCGGLPAVSLYIRPNVWIGSASRSFVVARSGIGADGWSERLMAVLRKDPWGSTLNRGFWALADQALVSLGTFLLNILVARNLPVEEFGGYALIFWVVLFVNAIHASVVVYPLSINSAAVDRTGLKRLAGSALGAAAVLVLPLSAVTVVPACLAAGRPGLVPWALGAAVLWQLQETLRRALMAHLRHREAVLGDAVSYLGQACVTGGLALSGRLSVETAFGAMAVTSAAAAVVQAAQLGLDRAATLRRPWAFAVRSCYAGRWVLLANLVTGAMIQIFNWTLAAAHGLGEVATLQAVGNVLRVANPVMLGISGLIVPATAQAYRAGGAAHARRVGGGYAALGGMLLLPYFAVVLLWPREILQLLYGPASPYLSLVGLLRLALASYVLLYFGQTLGAVLGGLERSRSVLLSQCAGAVAALVVGLPIVIRAGAVGSVIGAVVDTSVMVAVAARLVMRPDEKATAASEERPAAAWREAGR